jgi:hypothetical protein
MLMYVGRMMFGGIVAAVGHGIGEIDIPAEMARLAKSLLQE